MYQPEDGILAEGTDFRWLYEHLTKKTAGARLPTRQDISPADLKHLLTAINLVELVDTVTGPRLRYRLVGSLQSYFFAGDQNVTGRFLDEFWGDQRDKFHAINDEYQRAISRRGPVLGSYRKSVGRHEYLRYQRAIFPYTAHGEDIKGFLCLHSYDADIAGKSRAALNKYPVRRRQPTPSDPAHRDSGGIPVAYRNSGLV